MGQDLTPEETVPWADAGVIVGCRDLINMW